MMDNKQVKDNHQGGIERVKQKGGDMKKGQGGKMANKPSQSANWKRSGGGTPRKA